MYLPFDILSDAMCESFSDCSSEGVKRRLQSKEPAFPFGAGNEVIVLTGAGGIYTEVETCCVIAEDTFTVSIDTG